MIRKAEKADALAAAQLAVCMWDSHTVEELAYEFEELIDSEKAAVFLIDEESVPVGFAQCQLRYDYVEGTGSSPVGYLEGIFVKDEYRKQGYAAELLNACERWAKSCGCTEFASDCELDNAAGIRFHQSAGFSEANRIVCFTKKL